MIRIKQLTKRKRGRGNPVIQTVSQVGPGPARRHARRVQEFVEPMRADGKSLRECCEFLNHKGLLTWRGRQWKPANLHNVLNSTAGPEE